MNNSKAELIFILDRSGSMHGREADTIGGFNRVMDENREMPGEALITTLLFDDQLKWLHDAVPVAQVAPLTSADYRVGGCTALLDAIGTAITRVDGVRRRVPEEFRAGRVQFIIITDGMENASHEYTLPQIREMIEAHRKEGWDFLFLGANIDAISTAESMGISANRAVNAMSDAIGTPLQYGAVARATRAFRTAASPRAEEDAEWKAEVEADHKKRGRK